jgi:hypothetical protein
LGRGPWRRGSVALRCATATTSQTEAPLTDGRCARSTRCAPSFSTSPCATGASSRA